MQIRSFPIRPCYNRNDFHIGDVLKKNKENVHIFVAAATICL